MSASACRRWTWKPSRRWAIRRWPVTVTPGCDDLRRAIMQLPDEYREPLVLQVLGGFTTAEIAAELGLTQAAVLTRLFRARNRLRMIYGLAARGGRGMSPTDCRTRAAAHRRRAARTAAPK